MIFGKLFHNNEPKTENNMAKPEKEISNNAESKMSKAIKIYQKLINKDGIKRKDIIKEFTNPSVGLTPAGAATYYNLIKKKF